MRWYSRIAAAMCVALLQACATPPAITPTPPAAVAETREPVTILISIDGFRPDYLRRGVTPNLNRLIAEGLTGPMRPSFPTKTFPNHWTIVTGMVPDHTGLVGNKMEDAARPGEIFTMAETDPFWWNATPPIWVDAERAGIRTGTLFWPGSEVAFGGTATKSGHAKVEGGVRPQDWLAFNDAISETQRVNSLLDWLRRPAAIRPRLLTLYFDRVDVIGHESGPDSAEVAEAAATIDRQIGALRDGLAALRQPANLVIVSDHGMGPTSSERVVTLDLPAGSYHVLETGPYATVVPTPGQEAVVERQLLAPRPHMQCWRKQDIPSRFRYGSNPRVAPILCLAEMGWLILEKAPTKPSTGGAHGYDNQAPEMLALFIAAGPAFRHGTVPAFDNVDVYPLLRTLLGLPPRTGIDGTDAPFRPWLAPR